MIPPSDRKIPPLTQIRGGIRKTYSTVPPCSRPSRSAARVPCNGRARPGPPGRLGSGTAAVSRGALPASAPLSVGGCGRSFSVSATLTEPLYHPDEKMSSGDFFSPPPLHRRDPPGEFLLPPRGNLPSVRSAPFPAAAEGRVRSFAPPLPTGTAMLGPSGALLDKPQTAQTRCRSF